MSNPDRRSKFTGRYLALGCGALVMTALCAWLLSLIPGRILILGPRAPRPQPGFLEKTMIPTAATPTALPTRPAPSAAPTRTFAFPASPGAGPTQAPGGWEQISDGGSLPRLTITALAVDPENSAVILAGTSGGGVYVSRDGGQSWTASNTGLGKGTVGSLAVDPKDAQLVYAGMTDQGGVYRSTDGGRTWKPASKGIDLGSTWGWTGLAAIAASEPDVLYFSATNSGIYRSEDGGASWDRRGGECPQAMSLVVDLLDSAHLYAANRDHGQADCLAGVYESTDGGETWTRLATEETTTAPVGDWRHLAADERRPGRLIASSSAGTFLTEDGGRTWRKVHEACEWAAINPQNGALFCRQDGNLWISRDRGPSWEQSGVINAPYRHGSAPIAFVPEAKMIYLGDETVQQSADGGESWRSLGELGTGRLRLAIDPSDRQRLFLSATDKPGKILRSQDGGKSWKIALDGVEPGGWLMVDSNGTVTYPNPAGGGSRFYRSADGGATWEQFSQSPPGNEARQLLVDPNSPQTVWSAGECGGPLYRSQDGGLTFTAVADGPDGLCQPILAMDASGQSIYIFNWGNSYRSEDGGKSWATLAPLSGYFQAVVIDPREANTVYLGSTHLGVLKTTDGGQTWQAANTGLGSRSVNDLVIDPLEPDTIYAATDSGAYVTLDGGASWRALGGERGPNPMVYSLALDPANQGMIYAVTPDGLFRFWEP